MHLFKMLRNNRGELDLGGKTTFTAAEVTALVEKQAESLVQPKIDNIVQERLAREKSKYVDYDDLKKFRDEHTKQAQADEKAKLEAQGKYEEAMKVTNTKLGELGNVITEKDGIIMSMTIGNALTNEIATQGGYLEESLALLKSSAQLKDGVVTIKGKDANGLDKDFSVSDGIKAFLEKRPHLLKAKANAGGGGSGAGEAAAGGGVGNVDDLTTLNNLLATQSFTNDFKGAQETRAKIKAHMAAKGLTLANNVAF